MKLRRLDIEGFRGAPKPFPVPLRDKSNFIFSENGRGKSTISDALEFLASASLVNFRREDCGLDAAVNVNGNGTAEISAQTIEPAGEAKRSLTGDDPSGLEIDGDLTDFPPIPVLRQSTINEFMQQSAGDKRKALLELLDLDALNGFRTTLRTGVGNAKERRVAATTAHREEAEVLTQLLDGKDVLSAAAGFAATAGLTEPIASEGDLRALKLRLPPGEPNRQVPLTDLARRLEAVADDPAAEWDAAVADEEIRRGEALGTLLEQGQRVLDGAWEEDNCPLCESPQDRLELGERLRVRAEALVKSRHRLAALRQSVSLCASTNAALARAIGALLAVAPTEDWPSQDQLVSAKATLEAYVALLGEASEKLAPCPPTPDLGLDFAKLMPELQRAAEPKESPQLAALQSLNELRGQWQRVAKRRGVLEKAKETENSLKATLEICDETIKRAVEEALGDITDLVGKYFATLTADPVYTDIELVYAARRSGQVEFSVAFGDHTVKPPQRIMSESQLNGLGLALLLARVKKSDTPWRTLILDDVVNSFDAPHRAGLIRLLRQEFSEWQVLILSHDSTFRDIALREASDWAFQEIIVWTPLGGPVLGNGDPLARLEQALNAGEAVSALGGHSRKALELNTSRILARLGYPIPYDPARRYTAHDYLRALIAGLKARKSVIAESDVPYRIDTASYMATRAVHTRSDLPEPTTDDLRRLIQDIRDLNDAFRCGKCGKDVWLNENSKGHQCECGELKA